MINEHELFFLLYKRMMYFDKNKENIPISIYDLFEYTINKIKDAGLDIEIIDRAVIISNKLKSENRI